MVSQDVNTSGLSPKHVGVEMLEMRFELIIAKAMNYRSKSLFYDICYFGAIVHETKLHSSTLLSGSCSGNQWPGTVGPEYGKFWATLLLPLQDSVEK